MPRRLLARRPSPAMLVAAVALISSLTGGAVAATLITSADIKKNAVKSKHIKNQGVKGKDLKGNAVKSKHVKDGALLSEDFAAGQLPAGPVGPVGPTGPRGDKGAPGVDGADGAVGARGPSDAYEVRSTNDSVAGTAGGGFRSLALSGLPAGNYAVTAVAHITPTDDDGGSEMATCRITVDGTDVHEAFVSIPDGTRDHINVQGTLTLAAGQAIVLRCGVDTSAYEMGRFAGDTRIMAVRVSDRTQAGAAMG